MYYSATPRLFCIFLLPINPILIEFISAKIVNKNKVDKLYIQKFISSKLLYKIYVREKNNKMF